MKMKSDAKFSNYYLTCTIWIHKTLGKTHLEVNV